TSGSARRTTTTRGGCGAGCEGWLRPLVEGSRSLLPADPPETAVVPALVDTQRSVVSALHNAAQSGPADLTRVDEVTARKGRPTRPGNGATDPTPRTPARAR